ASAKDIYVLCLADLAGGRTELPAHHAAASVSAIWVEHVDALAGTEALDRLAQRCGLSAADLSRIEWRVAGTTLEPAAERAFSARLGASRYQVSAEAFLDWKALNAPTLPQQTEPMT